MNPKKSTGPAFSPSGPSPVQGRRPCEKTLPRRGRNIPAAILRPWEPESPVGVTAWPYASPSPWPRPQDSGLGKRWSWRWEGRGWSSAPSGWMTSWRSSLRRTATRKWTGGRLRGVRHELRARTRRPGMAGLWPPGGTRAREEATRHHPLPQGLQRQSGPGPFLSHHFPSQGLPLWGVPAPRASRGRCGPGGPGAEPGLPGPAGGVYRPGSRRGGAVGFDPDQAPAGVSAKHRADAVPRLIGASWGKGRLARALVQSPSGFPYSPWPTAWGPPPRPDREEARPRPLPSPERPGVAPNGSGPRRGLPARPRGHTWLFSQAPFPAREYPKRP